jgi:hypothetical protein
MRNLANRAMRLVNEDIDITRTDFAKQMPEPSFDKIIPIMNLKEYGVANGHNTFTAFSIIDVDLSGRRTSDYVFRKKDFLDADAN